MNKKEKIKIDKFNKKASADYDKAKKIFDDIYDICRDKGFKPCSSLQINVINILSVDLDLNSKMEVLDKYEKYVKYETQMNDLLQIIGN